MRGLARWLKRSLALLPLAAATVGAGASAPLVPQWTADPEEQFLLDVNLRQLRLGDGVRAYATPEGTCVLLGDFIATLNVPVTIDLAARKASGWAFREHHRIAIDMTAATATFGAARERLAAGTVRETADGWCVDSAALARWFGIGVKPVTGASVLLLESEAKLPVELAVERQQRAKYLMKRAKVDISDLPQVRLPYRLWRAPALDFIVNAGVTYSAATGAKVDRSSAVRAAGELAGLSYDAQLTTTPKGLPNAFRVRAYRSDPDGGLLGPLGATHVGLGDVAGLDSGLGGGGGNGRGALVTNRPLFNPTQFDSTRFEGDLPTGWEAELYRNGELVAFARPTADQRYIFDDVQLFYGENNVSIVLYGPQGQVRSRDELINVGRDQVPPGTTWYWAGFNQPGRDLASLHDPPDGVTLPALNAAASVEHGLDEKTSVGALARMLLVEDERVTFIEGSVRRAVGPAMVEVAAARDSKGGTALRAQMLARVGSANISADAMIADDFRIDGIRETRRKDVRLSVDAPLRIGRTAIPAHADIHLVEQGDGSRYLESAVRLSRTVNRFNLATDVRYRRQFLAQGPAPPGEVEMSLIGSGRVGDIRLRGSATAEVVPDTRLRTAELSAYWSASDRVDWEAGLAYDRVADRARTRVSHVRRFDALALAVTGEAASDGSLALGVNMNFSLDWSRGLNLSRQPLAGAGAIHARVYRDLNANGLRDPTEPLEEGALITTGTRVVERATNAKGAVMVGGLTPFVPVAVGIDSSSLSDPMLAPRTALQVVTPRPGVPAQVEIGLVGGGAVEGALVKSGGIGFEGVMLELVDGSGRAVAAALTDFDGFFLFDRVPYGRYRLRIAADSAAAANLAPDLAVDVEVTEQKSVVRVGALAVAPLPQLAARN